jgi:excisionase family DNA binding protein
VEPESRLPELLDAVGVADITGQHPRTILKAHRQGELAGVRLGRRTVRFRPEDVQQWLAAHRSGGGSP